MTHKNEPNATLAEKLRAAEKKIEELTNDVKTYKEFYRSASEDANKNNTEHHNKLIQKENEARVLINAIKVLSTRLSNVGY